MICMLLLPRLFRATDSVTYSDIARVIRPYVQYCQYWSGLNKGQQILTCWTSNNAIVSIVLFYTIFDLYDVAEYRDLEEPFKVIGNNTVWEITYMYKFLFVFYCNYGCILYRFRDKGRYWFKKIAIL